MLENKLGITDLAELAREEERSASKKPLRCLKMDFWRHWNRVLIKVLRRFINIFLMRFMISPVNYAKLIFQKVIFDLPR